MVLPPALAEYQVDLAGRLVVADSPGQVVKERRERYGFTQEWLAGLLGMRRESLSRVESGRVNLSMPFVQRFGKIMTLARGVREHLAGLEARPRAAGDGHPSAAPAPDEHYLEMLATGLRLDRRTADEVILASVLAYEQKRRDAIRQIQRRPDPAWQEARPLRGPPIPGPARSELPAALSTVRKNP